MTDSLYNKIKDRNISIYSLTSGRTIIGECLSSDSDGLSINCPLEVKKIYGSDGMISDKMIPFVTGNSTETCKIYHHCIECESHVSETVKQRYTEALIYDRLITLMTSEFLKDKEDLESSSLELDPPDYFETDEELWNSFLDRWKNTDV